MEGIQVFTRLFSMGLKDSIFGVRSLYKVDAQQRQLTMIQQQSEADTGSTLARRRRAARGGQVREQKSSEPRVLYRLFQCCAWNGGLFWLSIIAFHSLVLPCLSFVTQIISGSSTGNNLVWNWIGPFLTWTFGCLWVLPLFLISKAINSLWFQDIADATYRHTRGRPVLPALSKIMADILFSVLLQSLFLIQSMLMSSLPLPAIGQFVSLLHLCLLYSLYAFEYKWFNMGWGVHKRLSYIETNWPYFVGFGLPLALVTWLPSSFLFSGCVFSTLFPLNIISANEANPLNETCDFPLRLFSPVVAICNSIFRQSISRANPALKNKTPTKKVSIQQ